MEKDSEEKKLNEIIEYVNKLLGEELEDFDDLLMKYRRDPDRFATAYKVACNRIKVLEYGILKPYFARIDFRDEISSNIEKHYIGKYSLFDEKNNIIVVDWRAPISTLYYDSEIGDTQYECPDGIIRGNLSLKRQYEIENGKLLGYHDVDIVSNDELLQKYLNVNNEMRLKNIVSTIQKEQNYAIRRPLKINTIIQGVAGSGKTTIALHRIAYLVYNYRNIIKNNQYMVIGPNKVFLNYIKSVLPDLDVSDVEQLTYEELAKEITKEEFEVNPSAKALNSHLLNKVDNDISKYKNSDSYRLMLDEFLNDYFNSVITSNLEMNGFNIISKEECIQIFENAKNGINGFDKVIEKYVLLVEQYVLHNQQQIISRLGKEIVSEFNASASQKEKEQIKLKGKTIRTEIEKGCKTIARKSIKKYSITPIKLYKLFTDNINNYNKDDYKFIDELKLINNNNIKNKKFDFEDLPALIHIKYYLGLDREYSNYRHVVIDEAQDLGKFSFYTLKECMPNATFSIYGDIAQSIYDYRSIDNWQEVKEVFPSSELISFRKSYRTTDEIMNVANSISEKLNLDKSELSIRHGNDVTFASVDTNNIPEYIKYKIDEYKQKGYKTIAVISKYPTQSNYINDDLSALGLNIPNIDESTDLTSVNMSTVTISNYLAKGLEFDAVIINDASEKIYNSNSSLDMKMLYVALTRALHEMEVVYSDEITKPLEKFVEQKRLTK